MTCWSAALALQHPDAYKPLGKFKRRLPNSKLPVSVDWRGTGADPGVKDQGMCGSCFVSDGGPAPRVTPAALWCCICWTDCHSQRK
jgi:hypothetical protein